jgi:ATP-dependent Lhr-like helicase
MDARSAPPEEALHPRIRQLLDDRGFSRPTEIQALAWPALGAGQDALLVAPTGTGKTEAALLPVLSRLLSEPRPPVNLLYVTPLRALNRDLEARLLRWAGDLGLTAAVRHGDTLPKERLRQSRTPPDLLITTPETLQLLLVGKHLRQGLKEVQTVVVDEIHELASSDRGAQLALSLERLEAWTGHPVRRIGLSATVGNPEAISEFLSPHGVERMVISAPSSKAFALQVRPPADEVPALPPELRQALKADDLLLRALSALLEEVRAHRSTLLFVNTRPTAESLAARIRLLAPDVPLAVHHGSLSRQVREETEEAFRRGQLRVLIATSSLELGIDVGTVDHVVQFGSPHQASRLLQRVGRAGHRRDEVSSGTVIGLDDEDLEEAMVLSRRALAGEVEEIRVRTRNRLALAQQIVASLRAEGELPLAPLLARLRRAVPVRDLTDGEVEALVGFLQELGSLRREGGRIRPGRGTLNRFYQALSLIPEEKTYPLRDLGTRRLLGTLDERFVVTQVLSRPDFTFLLHGSTWRVVEFRDDELLVESVKEIGSEPRWVGEDLPVPFPVAQEMGGCRRQGDLGAYPLSGSARARLLARGDRLRAAPAIPDDRTVTLEMYGGQMVLGVCFGTRVNHTLGLLWSGLATSRFGVRSEVLLSEPTWLILGLPSHPTPREMAELLPLDPETVPGLLRRLVPASLEYRWTFTTVARKLGVIPLESKGRDLRTLEPLLEHAQETPLGEEVLEKTLHDRFDPEGTMEVFRRWRSGQLRLVEVPGGPSALGHEVLGRLSWQELGDVPPPTLLKAVRDRLSQESLVLLCVRCGFERTVTPGSYRREQGSRCLLCGGSLSAVLSPRREAELKLLRRYVRAKKRGTPDRRPLTPAERRVVDGAYATADLLLHHGERALLALAARGVGPETAGRILRRPYGSEEEFLTELLRAERTFAKTRAFWD